MATSSYYLIIIILSDDHHIDNAEYFPRFHLVNVAAISARAELPRRCHDFIIHQHSVLLYKDHLKIFFFTKFHKTYLCEALNIVLLYSTLRKGEALNIVLLYSTSGNMVNNISTVHKGSYLINYNNIKGKIEYNSILPPSTMTTGYIFELKSEFFRSFNYT